ncbi:MAG: DUF4388 domain-containing protein, partial [Planctomycetota bacterium]
MHVPEEQEIIELLSRVADVKQRLRQLETIRIVSGGQVPEEMSDLPPGALIRAKNHLELALEALGTPKWGFASTPASSLKITGFYSADIYKALKDIRQKARQADEQDDDPSPAEETSASTAAASIETKNWDLPSEDDIDWSFGADSAAPEPAKISAGPAPHEAVQGEGDGDGSSVWVQHRVDEIQRALTAAFGDEENVPEEETAPKPFSPPEFIGSTDALSIPELIGFFQLQRKTGVLTIDARQEQFTLEYLRGELIHARSSSAPDGQRLGEVLVRLGYLTESKLERLLAGKSNAERLGDALRRG